MANTNIINAVFGSGICAVTTSAYRANYGVKLRFSGIDLPTAFEVDFSNYDVTGRDSITMIGQNGEVQIPDDLWDSGLNIYAYVYLHPTDDSGMTVYTVTIPVLGRPNRTEETPTPHEQSVIEQAISALNDAVEQTAADVVAADASASAAAQSEANAATSERSAAASAGAALASQNAAESASQSATESASGAAESARNAAQSASQAAESATSAQESAEQAESSVQSIGDDVERAERAANTATGKATEASASAATASTKATQAEQSATAAAQSASSASTAAQNAAESEQLAESHATDAEQAKTDAQDAQAAAEQAKDDAVSAADRAEQAEQEVLSAMDGTYENLTSGNAQQLLSTVTEANSVPYLFRPTASNADRAYLDEVVGGTVAWNQQCNTLSIGGDTSDLTFTFGVNGAVTISGTSNKADWKNIKMFVDKSNHLLLTVVSPAFPEGFSLGSSYSNNARSYMFMRDSGNQYLRFAFLSGTVMNYNGHANVFDLTQLFGSTVADYIYNLETATAGAGVAYFRKLFPKDYYEFNSGELLSVNTSRHTMVGFNQFDGEYEIGYYDVADGSAKASDYWARSKNTIMCFPNTAYCFTQDKQATGSPGYILFYDASGNYLNAYKQITSASYQGGMTFTTPQNCYGMKYYSSPNWFTASNACINLSWSGYRNGEYEPYQEWVYPLDSSLTLRGIPKLDASGNLYYDGDTYAADGTVTRRYGVVDLGTLTWARNTQYVNPVFLASIPLAKLPLTSSLLANATCAIYEQKAATNTNVAGVNKVFAIGKYYSSGYELNVIDTSYTSASDFKTAMSGVYLVYELATPTTETATPYRHLQICDPNGTEEFMSTGIVPVGHNTRYPENLRAKIEGLPWNFNSIIAMTETTATASKAYSVGDYFILNNVLYRVTSAIASGGTITIGTNCRATTIMDEIKALS